MRLSLWNDSKKPTKIAADSDTPEFEHHPTRPASPAGPAGAAAPPALRADPSSSGPFAQRPLPGGSEPSKKRAQQRAPNSSPAAACPASSAATAPWSAGARHRLASDCVAATLAFRQGSRAHASPPNPKAHTETSPPWRCGSAKRNYPNMAIELKTKNNEARNTHGYRPVRPRGHLFRQRTSVEARPTWRAPHHWHTHLRLLILPHARMPLSSPMYPRRSIPPVTLSPHLPAKRPERKPPPVHMRQQVHTPQQPHSTAFPPYDR